jgi:hypothetical protein
MTGAMSYLHDTRTWDVLSIRAGQATWSRQAP